MKNNSQPDLPEWMPWKSPFYYLADIYRNVRFEEIKASECEQILREIESSTVNALVNCRELLNFQNWNLPKIQERDKYKTKPRIFLSVEETSKENLTFRWRPQSEFFYAVHPAEQNETDFNSHIIRSCDESFFNDRPINELIFIHNIWRLCTYDQKPLSHLKHCLLLAIAALIRHLQEQLSFYCEIKLINDLEFQFEDKKIIGWSIYNVEERKIENEKKWIENFEVEWGLSPKKFLDFYEQTTTWDKCAEMNKLLKKAGFNFPLKKVRETIQRMQTYHTGLFSKK